MAEREQEMLKGSPDGSRGLGIGEPFPCSGCGGEISEIWAADNDLWNEINGSPNGFMCPACFERLANEAGYTLRWKAEAL